MAEVPDRRSFIGRVGALTVIGELRFLGGGFSSNAFEMMKVAWRQFQYSDLADLTELYALRWSLFRFPDANRDSLIFETAFHGDWEQYLNKLVRKTAIGIDIHARFIKNYPGTADVETFLSFPVRHHNPALHVYAANPMMSPVDIDQFTPFEDPNAAATPIQGRWFGFIIALRPGRARAVRELFADWSWSNSPFHVPTVQHGRAVLVERGAQTYLLVSVVHAVDPALLRTTRTVRARNDLCDRLIASSLTTDHEMQWKAVLRHTVASAPTRHDLLEAFLSHRYGHGPDGSIRWVDWSWSFLPETQRAFWASERCRPHLLPSEHSRRPPSEPL